jgi:hypothetical protein
MGTAAWIRTKDQLIKSQLLYQLSYRGMGMCRMSAATGGAWVGMRRRATRKSRDAAKSLALEQDLVAEDHQVDAAGEGLVEEGGVA